MTRFLNLYRIESARLRGWNYAHPGFYFLTVVCHNRQCLFGDVLDGEMVLNEFGRVVESEWLRSGTIRNEIRLDAFVVMPNHFHAIVEIISVPSVDAPLEAHGVETQVETQGLASLLASLQGDKIPDTGVAYRRPKSVSSLMAGFKSACTQNINRIRNTPRMPVWQPRFYDRIIRDASHLHQTREYIRNNPAQWLQDSLRARPEP